MKEIISNPESGFTGFMRCDEGSAGAFCFVSYEKQLLKPDVITKQRTPQSAFYYSVFFNLVYFTLKTSRKLLPLFSKKSIL